MPGECASLSEFASSRIRPPIFGSCSSFLKAGSSCVVHRTGTTGLSCDSFPINDDVRFRIPCVITLFRYVALVTGLDKDTDGCMLAVAEVTGGTSSKPYNAYTQKLHLHRQ